MGASIYIADDEKNIRDLITKFLECDGYSVTAFETGDELMEEFLKKPCELVILDIMMPGTDGLTICRQLRTITDVPIIMLTAKDSEYDYVRGITLGGDDYLTKPFNSMELIARVKSQVRRYTTLGDIHAKTGGKTIEIGRLCYDLETRSLFADGEPVHLTATESKIFDLLIRNAGRIFPAEEIYERVWNEPAFSAENTVMVHIRRIREKIELNPKEPEYLKVVWGIGYKIEKHGR